MNSLYYEGLSYYKSKQYKKALACFEQSDNINAPYYRGIILFNVNRKYTDAIECFNKVLRHHPLYIGEDVKMESMGMARRALSVNLLHQNKFNELVTLHTISGIDELDETEFTPLMCSVLHRNHVMIEKLVDIGANPFKVDKYGNSAFSYAVNNRDNYTVKILLKNTVSLEDEDELITCIKKLMTTFPELTLNTSERESYLDTVKQFLDNE